MIALTSTCTLLRPSPAPRLLTSGEYDRLLSAGNAAAVLTHLASSPYAPAVAAARRRHVGHRAVVEACRLHLGDALRSLRGVLGPGRTGVDLLLARWDAANLRLILLGQAAGVPIDDIVSGLVPAGELGDDELGELAATATPARLVAALRPHHPIYAAILAAASRHASDPDALDDEVAARFHGWRLDALTGASERNAPLITWLAIEADAHNLASAHRARGPRPQTYLPGGSVDRATLARIRAGEDAPLQATLDRALSLVHAAEEDASVLSAAIRWAAAKEVEVEDVRWIASGVALGSTRAEIEGGLLGAPVESRRRRAAHDGSSVSHARGGP